MKLPNKFQFRQKHYSGFTHTAQVNEIGDYEVKWARGYPEYIKAIPVRVFESCDVEWMVNDGYWQIVHEAPQEQSLPVLPDEFYFYVGDDTSCQYLMKRNLNAFKCYNGDGSGCGAYWREDEIKHMLTNKTWTIIDKRPLTVEQQRANKEAREQIAQLNSSIRISEQNVEHQLRLQASYRERIEILNSKIVEE